MRSFALPGTLTSDVAAANAAASFARRSFRLRRQNLVETRMRKLNLSMIKSLHSSKREQELDDAMKIQALKKEGGARAAALDAFFEERIGMAESAIRVQESER